MTSSTILVVTDDEASLNAVRRAAGQALPHAVVIAAQNGLVGLQQAERLADRLALAVVDLRLSLIDGPHTAASIRAFLPHVRVVPCLSDLDSAPFFADLRCCAPIFKPITIEKLAARLSSTLAEPAAPPPTAAWLTAMLDQTKALIAFAYGSAGFAPPRPSVASVDAVCQEVVLARDLATDVCHMLKRLHRQFGTRMPVRGIERIIADIQTVLN